MDMDRFLSLIRYGDEWQISRRLFHQEFNINTPMKFVKTQEKYVQSNLTHNCASHSNDILCSNALELIKEDPLSFEEHIKYFAAGFILEVPVQVLCW